MSTRPVANGRQRLNQLEVRAISSTLVAAGSETTGSLLTGATWLLLSNPAALEKVKKEVRSAFKSDDEITMTAVNGLPYLLACLNEALRMYPPVPTGLPRIVPDGFGPIAGHIVPVNVRITTSRLFRLLTTTERLAYLCPSTPPISLKRTGQSLSNITLNGSWATQNSR
jgi:hypothetical protein